MNISANLHCYRKSQASSLEQAMRDGANIRIDDVHGVSALLSVITAMVAVADMMDHESARDDIMVRVNINHGKWKVDCTLADARELILILLNKKEV